MTEPPPSDWVDDCLYWRGVVLTGQHAHWCAEWDGLPIDETCPEWPCCQVAESVHPDFAMWRQQGRGERA